MEICWKHDRHTGHEDAPTKWLVVAMSAKPMKTSGLNLRKSVHKNKLRNAMEAGDDKYQTCFMKYVKNKACQLYFTHVSPINFFRVPLYGQSTAKVATRVLQECYVTYGPVCRQSLASHRCLFSHATIIALTHWNHAGKCSIKTRQSWN